MSNKLYVGHLSLTTTEESLRAAFAAVGSVQDVSMPISHGQPRGFAYVTMGSPRDATMAISELNGATLDGRQIVVNEAPSHEPGGGGGRGFPPGGGGR